MSIPSNTPSSMTTNSTSTPREGGLAVVTGASSGIGLALARELAGRGHDLVVCAEDAAIDEAAADLSQSGAAVVAVRADLSTVEGVEALVTQVRATDRPLEVLALNAGIAVAGPFVETPLEDDLRLIALNVTSAVHAAKRLLPDMVARGQGRLLVTSSIAGVMPGPWYATYAASKAFLLSFAEAVRYELRDTGVTVTALMPGPTDTDFFDRAGLDGAVVDSMSKDDPADVARDGIDALMDGEDHIVAHSWRNKAQAALLKGMPEPAKAATHAQLSKRKD